MSPGFLFVRICSCISAVWVSDGPIVEKFWNMTIPSKLFDQQNLVDMIKEKPSLANKSNQTPILKSLMKHSGSKAQINAINLKVERAMEHGDCSAMLGGQSLWMIDE